MDLMLSCWKYVQMLLGFFFYVRVFAVLILLEKYLIRRRSKGEWILPVVLLVGAMVLSAATFSMKSSADTGMEHVQVFVGAQEVGRVIWINSREKGIVALGQYISGADEQLEFIDLEMDKDKVIKTSLPISQAEKKGIEDIFSYRKRKFTGESISYKELAAMKEANPGMTEEVTWGSFLLGMRLYGGPGLILAVMYLWSLIRRKRANLLMKSKLKDI